MNNINYQKILDKELDRIQSNNITPTLLLHSCCAPCSSYVIEYLSKYFKITVFYYNPNISPDNEYRYRANEQKRLIESMPLENPVEFLEGEYIPDDFFDISKGLENEPEGGARCAKCFNLRLSKTAETAKQGNYDYFTTTLTISPLKNAKLINNIGIELSKKYDVPYLQSDFKKKNGYKRSIVLSKEYNLYRQNYCGCIFSKNDTDTENSD
ncbi:MAG: epoxyqueuosine reductase QueH [Acutalibacteraceae bacterium]|nr:epoxyqueuosine reductase QueH [Acutalibacteraceae bacterium]